VIQIEPARFDEMVERALDGLPEKFGEEMKNIAVTVEHQPGPPRLLGLYRGIPLTQRGSGYAGVLPDRITIYARAICAICDTEQEVAEQVRRTVIHASATTSASVTSG
jgi:predicted Zn-dependent protease with MMP-like domain